MDLIFLHVTTYALSSTVLPVVQRAKVPVIILNLAPAAAIELLNALNMILNAMSKSGAGGITVGRAITERFLARLPFERVTVADHIPFPETRNYVTNVLKLRTEYRDKYARELGLHLDGCDL